MIAYFRYILPPKLALWFFKKMERTQQLLLLHEMAVLADFDLWRTGSLKKRENL